MFTVSSFHNHERSAGAAGLRIACSPIDIANYPDVVTRHPRCNGRIENTAKGRSGLSRCACREDLDRSAGLFDRRDRRFRRRRNFEGEHCLDLARAEDLHAVARLAADAGGDERIDRDRRPARELAGVEAAWIRPRLTSL